MLLPLTTASAVALDDFGSPPPTPPSAFTNPPADLKAALDVLTLPPAHQGATVLPNGKPSRLFWAQPYTQQLLLLEEYGTEKLDPTLPTPTSFALASCVHPGADVPRLHRPGTEHLAVHPPPSDSL